MVSYNFYTTTLDPFNEAEMLRSPLDKVLLKICVLDEEIERKNDLINHSASEVNRKELTKMNEIFLGIAKKIFCSPAYVLSIALEMPSWD